MYASKQCIRPFMSRGSRWASSSCVCVCANACANLALIPLARRACDWRRNSKARRLMGSYLFGIQTWISALISMSCFMAFCLFSIALVFTAPLALGALCVLNEYIIVTSIINTELFKLLSRPLTLDISWKEHDEMIERMAHPEPSYF